MADSHAEMTQTRPQEVIISIVAGLLAPLLAIVLIVLLVLNIQGRHLPDTTDEVAQKATAARIQPIAQLVALDANAPKVEKSGQEVYDAICAACHGSGALNAPKFDNKADWGSRLGQGYDTLLKHAIEGIRAMPPRGGASNLSDAEVARAVVYMANSAGANFSVPEAAPAPAAEAPAADAPAVEAAAPGAAAPQAAATAAAAPAPAAPAAAAAPKADPAKGKQVYQTACALCHAAGVAGAPKPGDKEAWGPRLAQGYATLYDHALNGIRGMPPRGGNPSLSEADLANAVGYMVTESGGKL